MCGFVGVIRNAGRSVRADEFEPLRPSLARRGPDGGGTVVDGEIGLLSTRLAVQGGRESDQPLRSADGRFVLAYNGEILGYHRRALRTELRAQGAGEVRAASDTELLLAWLEHHLRDRAAGDPIPPAALGPLRGGMYAFALVDLRTREVVLHTDGGIKPLHVMPCPDRGETWFASTLAPLFAVDGGARVLDRDELAWRLSCPSPRRPLAAGARRIEELAGRTAVVGSRDAAAVRFRAAPTEAVRGPVPDLDQVREAFSAAARGAAEVSGPVSLLLSGGLDSAAVAAWCDRRDVLAITGRFAPEGGAFDESADAAVVAAAHGLVHEVIDLEDRDLLLDLPDVVEALEEPIGGPGSLPIHRLARRARAHGRVALSGTGGDERFGGYARIAIALGRHGSWTEGYGALADRMDRAGTDPRARWLAAVDRSEDLLPWLHRDFAASLPVEAARGAVREALFGPASGTAALPPARALVEAEIRTTLRMLLHVEDRVTMALSLESRPVPCLGTVAEVASRLPPDALVGADGETKRALRRALDGRIPESVRTNRRKRGFPTPFHRAATGAGRDLAEAVLRSARFRERGWWNVEACLALLDARRSDHDRALFTILCHEAWARRFLDAPPAGRAG